jgi:hypothetical protein
MVTVRSCQWPRRSKKEVRLHASCQVRASSRSVAAMFTTANRTRVLGGEPGEGLPVVGQLLRCGPGLGRVQDDRIPIRIEQ